MKTKTTLKTTIIVLLLIISNLLSAQDLLHQYLETAARNNPALKAKFSEYNASLEKIPQVRTLPDPQIIFGYFISPVETRNGPQQAKISVTQMFPWFGTLISKEDVFINAAKAHYEDFEETKSNLFFEIKSNYYDLYFIKKGIDINMENIQIINTFKRLVIMKIEASSASGVDELLIEMELADLENNLALLKDNWYVNAVKFNHLLNVDKDSEIQIPTILWLDDLMYSKQAILDSLSINNHQLKSLDFMLLSYENKEQLAQKTGTPNIILGVDYIAIGSNDLSMDSGKDALMIKLGFTIPIYRKKYSSMVKEAVFQQEVIAHKKVDKINVLETLIEKAHSEYTDAIRRITLFEKQSDLAKRAIQLLESEYILEGRNFEEVLRMEKNLLNYSLQ
ncbi:MAG: hypothetical protein GQ527_04880, partial [Bacteroidales bacterium]|nr:hypothetical protein [Bacteroidales bacterium]